MINVKFAEYSWTDGLMSLGSVPIGTYMILQVSYPLLLVLGLYYKY